MMIPSPQSDRSGIFSARVCSTTCADAPSPFRNATVAAVSAIGKSKDAVGGPGMAGSRPAPQADICQLRRSMLLDIVDVVGAGSASSFSLVLMR